MKELGIHIKALREGQNLSQNKLSKLAGVNRQTIISLEKGRIAYPQLRFLGKILRALGYKIKLQIVTLGYKDD